MAPLTLSESNRMILVATPMADGRAEQEYIHSLFRGFDYLSKMGIKHDYVSLAGDCFIDRARNRLVSAFMASDFEYIFFIDSDISFQPDAIYKVFSHGKPISGGVYVKRCDPPEWSCVIPEEIDGLTETDALPGGFTCVHRSVFASIDAPEYEYNGSTLKEYYKSGNINGKFVGEDIYFGRLAKEHGFSLFLDPSIQFGHIGKKTYTGRIE